MLKPVDLQTVMPRSFELQKVQQTHNIRPALEQHEFAKEMDRLAQQQKVQVQQGSGSAAGQIIEEENPERQKNNGRRYRRFQAKNSDNSEAVNSAEDSVSEERGRLIDIKI